MEVHKQYNLRSRKSNDLQTKKAAETKKTSDISPKKGSEKKNAKTLARKISETLPRPDQTQVASTSRPSISTQKTVVEKPDSQSQSRTPTTLSLEGELAKLKFPIPLTELMNKNTYRAQVIKN
jgi:hypothetical protein